MEKLDKYLGGVKNMKTLPKAMFIVDPHKERIAAVSYTHLPAAAVGVLVLGGGISALGTGAASDGAAAPLRVSCTGVAGPPFAGC